MEFPQEVLLPQKVIYNINSCLQVAEESIECGRNGLIVHGKSLEKNGKINDILAKFPASAKIECFCRGSGEPTISEIKKVIQRAKSIKAQWIVGIGGGSVLDLAKAAAGLYNAKENPEYYQQGGALKEIGIPFIAVPTTAGSGAEATPNSVIIDEAKKVKLSIRDKSFLAKKVILDAGLLKCLPPSVMSYSGMDALVQGYEAFVSKNSTWFSDSFALKAIDLINSNIVPAYKNPDDNNLSSLLLGSFFAGIALASARLGVIHGIAHPLGVLYNEPHGLICSVCLIPSIEINKKAMGEKYKTISGVMGMDFTERVKELLRTFEIQSPFKGQSMLEKEDIIIETLKSGSTAANPKKIEREDVEYILRQLS